jgi:hypothetical protein
LVATAAVFDAGRARLRHVEVIARLLDGPAARRLGPEVWAGAEAALAEKATEYTPTELQSWGAELIEKLDADGPEPDDRPPAAVNELHLLAHRGRPGGTLKGRFDDAALYDAIATLIDTVAAPRTGDDERSAAQRQAEALAEVCGYVLDHGEVPESGGRHPHLNVIIGLDDLESRARAAMLDFGGRLSPESLRLLACDAAVVPIVMNGAGQPLDVGRAKRTVPDGLRRAVPPATAAAPAAAVHPRGARSTTSSRGRSVGRPSSATASCSARAATGWFTTAGGSCGSARACPSSSHRPGSTPTDIPPKATVPAHFRLTRVPRARSVRCPARRTLR